MMLRDKRGNEVATTVLRGGTGGDADASDSGDAADCRFTFEVTVPRMDTYSLAIGALPDVTIDTDEIDGHGQIARDPERRGTRWSGLCE